MDCGVLLGTVANVDSRPLNKFEIFAELARYPDPPKPVGVPMFINVPAIRGIYFLHNQGRIEYVGKSEDIRARIGGLSSLRHHAIEEDDQISWIRFDEDECLEFIECYYIWLCRPGRNFGRKDQCFQKRIAQKNMVTSD